MAGLELFPGPLSVLRAGQSQLLSEIGSGKDTSVVSGGFCDRAVPKFGQNG